MRAHLRGLLPSAMIPARFLVVDRFPTTAGGKVDRPALRRDVVVPQVDPGLVPPRTDAERLVHSCWVELLGHESVGVTDDFFELGGDSLSALELAAWMADRLARPFPSTEVATCATIALLAAVLEHDQTDRAIRAKHADQPTAASVLSCLSVPDSRGAGVAVALFAGGGDSALSMVSWARHLSAQFEGARPVLCATVYGVQGHGIDDEDALFSSVSSFASAAVAELRATHPGPYVVGGYSVGGIVAQEAARQLEVLGDRVELVVILDSSPPVGLSLPLSTRAKRSVRAALARRRHPGSQTFTDAMSTSAAVLDRGPDPAVRDVLRDRKGVVHEAHVHAGSTHRPRSCAAPLLLIRAADHPRRDEPWARSWGQLTRSAVSEVIVPGTHVTIKHDPNIAAVARAVLDALRDASTF